MTGGPPDSFHLNRNCLVPLAPSIRPSIVTRALGDDSAPYFTELVLSSCTMSAKFWAAGVLTEMLHPLTLTWPSKPFNSSEMISLSGAPTHALFASMVLSMCQCH